MVLASNMDLNLQLEKLFLDTCDLQFDIKDVMKFLDKNYNDIIKYNLVVKGRAK